ncbi:hypothetical protein MSL71_39950 [Desulfoluna butyratoxydans]|uniref:Uncharacterized protein n=1 Tax=Desulfoluna butyratoxydans TaxID=231438 RepID=A0A4U8YR30_9BACT|nr:hypothetical protein MSL71_39950 [Desulfoluna butyratoxydans]
MPCRAESSINKNLFVKLFKSLAPGRAAGGCFGLNGYSFFYYLK